MVPELSLPTNVSIRFVFPHAPVKAVTINGGAKMRAWYDILGMDFNAVEDQAGIRLSQTAVEALIAEEKKRGIPADKIFWAVFLKAAQWQLHAGLRYKEK